MATQTKVCSLCKLEKPHESFSKDKRNKFGISAWCKECHNNYNKARTKQKLNDPEYRAKYNEYQRNYHRKRSGSNGKKETHLCKEIKRHHAEMKDVPGHLTTNFIIELIGKSCDRKDKIKENLSDVNPKEQDPLIVTKPRSGYRNNIGNKRYILSCPVCGKQFSVMGAEYRYRIKKRGKPPCCSRECGAKQRKNGKESI